KSTATTFLNGSWSNTAAQSLDHRMVDAGDEAILERDACDRLECELRPFRLRDGSLGFEYVVRAEAHICLHPYPSLHRVLCRRRSRRVPVVRATIGWHPDRPRKQDACAGDGGEQRRDEAFGLELAHRGQVDDVGLAIVLELKEGQCLAIVR